MIRKWGEDTLGRPVYRIVITKDQLTASLITLGATVQDLRLSGHSFPLVLGYPELNPYLKNPYYFGATIGRYANRIRNGQCRIAGNDVQLDVNDGATHHLHGGQHGSHSRNWKLEDHGETFALFSDVLSDGHMGYPGALEVWARFKILDDGILDYSVEARATATTLCNFTNHSYFNLDGLDTVRDHCLKIAADRYIGTDKDGIPTGTINQVSGSDFDYRQRRTLAQKGIIPKLDHNYCFQTDKKELRDVAELTSNTSGIQLTLATAEPGVQVYTGSGIGHQADATGLRGEPYCAGSGIALEPQIWPDSPNQTGFPSAEIGPKDRYIHHTQYKFRKSDWL